MCLSSNKKIATSPLFQPLPLGNDLIPRATVRVPPTIFAAQGHALPLLALLPGRYIVTVTTVTAGGADGNTSWVFVVEVRLMAWALKMILL